MNDKLFNFYNRRSELRKELEQVETVIEITKWIQSIKSLDSVGAWVLPSFLSEENSKFLYEYGEINGVPKEGRNN